MKLKSKKGVHKTCVECRKGFVRIDKTSGKEIPAISRYPFCFSCMYKRSKDPDFVRWAHSKINA